MAKLQTSTTKGWKNIRVRREGAPAKVFTVREVRDAIEQYKRDFFLHPETDAKQFTVEELK